MSVMLQQKIKFSNLHRYKEISNAILKKRIHTHKALRRSQIIFDQHKHKSNTGAFQKLRRYTASAAQNYMINPEQEYKSEHSSPNAQSIDDILSKIDESARHFGRILKTDVLTVFEAIKDLGLVTSIQSLYLLRCCGSLMAYEIPSERSQLLNEIWNKLMELDVPVDASHYNAMLKAHLENGYAFTPTDILMDMEQKKIQPNRVTYQRLIDKFSDDGDLNGASTILEFMKKQEIAVNEAVFNSLVKCHTKLRDFEGAKNTMKFMRNMEKSMLKPNSSTYAVLACGYAETGNIEEVFSTISEANENGVQLSNKDLLSIIFKLAVSGHDEHINEIFSDIDNLPSSRHECLNMILELCNHGVSEDVCFKLVQTVAVQAEFRSGMRTFIQRLIQLQKPTEKILQFCHILSNDCSNILLAATRFALEYHNIPCALELFRELQKQGLPLRSHFFWPIFAFHIQEQNEQAIWDTLKCMADMGFPADFDTYISYVLPGINIENIDDVLQKNKRAGQSDTFLYDTLFQHYCSSNNLEQAIFLIHNYPIDCNVNVMIRILMDLIKDDSSECDGRLLQILQFVHELSLKSGTKFKDFYGEFFLNLSNMKKLPKSLLVAAHRLGLGLSPFYANAICENFVRNDPEKLQIVRSLQYGAPLPKSMYNKDAINPRDMDLGTLEKHLSELKASGETTRTTLRHLLTLYCRNKDLDKILATKKELDLQGFTYTPALYALLINAFLTFNDLKECEELRHKMETEFPDVKLDALKVTHYCSLLIKCNKGEEAIALLEDHCSEVVFENKDMLLQNVRKLVNVAADTGDIELTNKICNFFLKKLDLKDPKHIMDGLVRVHIARNDLRQAIKEYEHCFRTSKIGPSRRMLMKKCIMNHDANNLQQIIDITAAFIGKVTTLHELAFSFIECGQGQKARKVFQNLGERTEVGYLVDLAARLAKENKVEELENFIEATKDLTHINRDVLYFNLLNLYAQNNDYSKALDLWDVLQDENVQPSVNTLRLLADLLAKNDQPVPFVVPGQGESSFAKNKLEQAIPMDQELTAPLLKSIHIEDVDRVIEILQGMKKGNIRSLTTDTMTNIITLLLNNNRLNELSSNVQVMSYVLEKARLIFKPLLEKTAESGKVDALKEIMHFLPDFALKSIAFNYYFTQAHLSSGQYEELMTELEKYMGTNMKVFTLSGFVKLLAEAPHLEDRAEQLVEDYAKKENFDIPRRALWLHYFIQEKFDKAEEIFKNNITLFTGIDMLASQVLKHIRTTSNDSLARKFIEFIRAHDVKPMVRDRTFSCLLDVLSNQEKVEEAAEVLNEAQKSGVPITRFSRRTLTELKEKLTERNLPVTFEIPSQGDDSSSSSDSD